MRNRIGKFYVSRHLVEDDPKGVMILMGRVVVLRAELLWARNAFEYIAISDAFDEIKEGECPPEYTVYFHAGEDSPTVTFQRWGA